ncbi:MAG: hypothetical protein ACE5I9_01695 [Candidatus Methylomirabilales bacterium]
MICKRCGKSGNEHFHRVDSFERITLADDPADPNCGHYYVETVYVMRCAACEHRQEAVEKRWPFKTLREAQKELDSYLIGKG